MPKNTQWNKRTHKMVAAGIQTATPPDLKTQGKFRVLQNVRVREAGKIQPRPGLEDFNAIGNPGGNVHSLRGIFATSFPVASQQRIFVGSSANVGMMTEVVTFTHTEAGWSGRPVSFVAHRPELQGERWMYVYDSSKQKRKNKELSTAGVNAWTEIGIAQPSAAASGEYDITKGGAASVAVGAATGPTGSYRYVYRFRADVTGVRSNYSAESAEVTVANQKVDLSSIATTSDAQADKVDIFRIGGALTVYTYVGTINEGTTTFTDAALDIDIAANETREGFERHKPWVSFEPSAAGGNEGVTKAGKAFGRCWGPLAGFLLACGDPANPGNLYWTNGNDPDSQDQANFLEVSGSNEPLVNGGIWDSRGFVFTNKRLQLIYPSIGTLTTFEVVDTSCSRGLFAPWAYAVGPEIYFLAHDGIYAWSGGREKLLSADINNMFPHEGADEVLGAIDGMIPPEMDPGNLDSTQLRLHYYNGFLYFDYEGTDSNQHSLVYDFSTEGWFYDDYPTSLTVQMHYGFEGDRGDAANIPNYAESRVLAGTVSGAVMKYVHGFRDNSLTFACKVWPGFDDVQDPRTQKLWGDSIVEVDPADLTVNVTPEFDLGATAESLTAISGGSGRQLKIIDHNAGNGRLARNMSVKFEWDVNSDSSNRDGPYIYAWHPSWTDKPDETVRRAIEWHEVAEGVKDAYVWGVELWIDTEGADVVFEVHSDQVSGGPTSVPNITVNSSGEKKLRFTWVGTVFYGKLFKLLPISGETDNWRLTKWDWLFDATPPLTPDFDTGWLKPIPNADVAYVTGCKVTLSTQGNAKTLIFNSALTGVAVVQTAREGGGVTTVSNPAGGEVQENRFFSFEPFRATLVRVLSTDGVDARIFEVEWIAQPEPAQLANWDSTFEDFGKRMIIKGVEIYADTLGGTKTVRVELDGVLHESLTVSQGRISKYYPLSFGSLDDFPKASTARLLPINDVSDTQVYLYRVRWIGEPEPDFIANWNAAYKDLKRDHIIKGIYIDADTEGVSKTVRVELDDVLITTLTVNHAGRLGQNFPLPTSGNEFPRGKVIRLRPTDSNPGELYHWEPIAEPEPARLANWDASYKYFERPNLIKGVAILMDTEGTDKTIRIELDGTLYQTLSGVGVVNTSIRQEKVFAINLTAGEFPTATSVRLVPTDSNPGWLYRVRWLSTPEPDDIENWDAAWQNLKRDHLIKGVEIESDTGGVAKTVEVQLDQVTIATLTVNTSGRQGVNYPIAVNANGEFPRGQVIRLLPTDSNPGKLYSWQPIAEQEPWQLENWDASYEDLGQPHLIKGVAILCDTEGNAKTVRVELDGALYTTLTVNSGATAPRKELVFPMPRTGGEFPIASTVRLRPTDTDDQAYLYRARWLKDEYPDLIDNWDVSYRNISEGGRDGILKGIMIEADTGGLAKTVEVQIDGTTVDTLTVNFSGRKADNFPLVVDVNGEFPRGKVVRLLPTDSNTGRLFKWEPIAEPEPPKITNWNPQWTDAGHPGAKFVQGVRITADTQTLAKTVNVQYTDATGSAIKTNGPHTVDHVVRDTKVISFSTPFLAHNLRLVPTDSNAGWLYNVEWIWEPAPDLATTWETQETSLGLKGYWHARRSYIALVSSDVVTWVRTIDGVAQTGITIASTAGGFRRTHVVFPAVKGKSEKWKFTSPAGFRLFQKDCEMYAKEWGSQGEYRVFRPFGDVHYQSGARI